MNLFNEKSIGPETKILKGVSVGLLLILTIMLCLDVYTFLLDKPFEPDNKTAVTLAVDRYNLSPLSTNVPFKEELVLHLSKEIELANQQLVEQRTKNNLLVAFGPFLILGALVANSNALHAFQKIGARRLWWFGLNVVLGYGVCGILAARVEFGIWDRMNRWRVSLAELTGIGPERLFSPTSHITLMYVGIFTALGIIFAALMWLLYEMKTEAPAQEKEK